MRGSYNGNTLAFQARAAGPIPARRSRIISAGVCERTPNPNCQGSTPPGASATRQGHWIVADPV